MQLLFFYVFICFLSALSAEKGWAQEQDSRRDLPPISSLRAEEDYLYLQDEAGNGNALSLEETLKYLPVTSKGNVYARVGGQYRIRWEHFTNADWTDEVEQYYSQRINMHVSFHVGDAFRLFGELYHGLTSNEERLFQDDEIDLHQGFVEWVPVRAEQQAFSVRLGRQELNLGASRLIGIRDGPNIRRSFDLAKITYNNQNTNITLFGGKEVNPRFAAFDNVSTVLEELKPSNPGVWAVYAQLQGPIERWVFDIYYIGFQSKSSVFNDVAGQETRHTIGIRSSGNSEGPFSFNTELIAQFGRISDNKIRAFNVETDWKYVISSLPQSPSIGIKLDWSSGDQKQNDGIVQTFNPLFVNPAIYSLAGVNTPANLTSFHPNITVSPSKNLVVYFEYAVFYRTTTNDGFYAPPRFQTRQADNNRERHIGDVIGVRLAWKVNRNVSLTLMSSYYLAGSFIEGSGPSNNIFFVSPTLDLKF